jgi:hypothetical protein
MGVALGLAACAPNGGRSPDPARAGAIFSTNYLRVMEPGSNTVQLQIALKRFVPVRGSGPTIWLTGASHLGESNYYAALQRHLDAQELVLFEGVRNGPSRISDGAGIPEPDETSLQWTLARSLGLEFQLKAIDYRQPHFRNSDLSVEEIVKLMSEEGNDAEGAAEFHSLLEAMDGSTFLGALVNFAVRLLATSPKLQSMARLTLIETFQQTGGDLSSLGGLPPEMRKLVAVLIESRNEAVMRDLRDVLRRRPAPRSVSIFFGAAHMPDMERRLSGTFAYRLAEERWLTAMSVDFSSAGLSPTERDLVRGMVRWQMDQLRAAPRE